MWRKKIMIVLVIGSWYIWTLFYNNNSKLPFGKHNFNIRKPSNRPVEFYNGSENYLINTVGCYIPNYAKTLQFTEANDKKISCGKRAVFVDKKGYNIRFRIDRRTMQNHYNGSQRWECCYRFASRSTKAGQEDSKLNYSPCTKFDTGTTTELKTEVVVVSCTTIPTNESFYDDAYIFIKKIKSYQSTTKTEQKHWNVLVLGMDTMSRARLLSSMPKTASYLNQHGWLDYKGYNKVGYNTFPNLMAFLTGKKMSTVYRSCAKSMDKCNDDIIWSKFKNFGYVTAYGEDFLQVPDTFSPYNGFKTPPTNHYMRPLYLTGETRKGNFICNKQVPSALNALNYALDFVNSYKNDKFFGMFWLNSYSHDLNNSPSLLDNDTTAFLDNLNSTLLNTFIFFLSDHGIRYGKMRLPMESYYEERLPMFFMWVPLDFQKSLADAHNNLKLNQIRLTTPYNLYETFRSILQLSSGFETGEKSGACPKCKSLFEEQNEHRTCKSASIDEKWCSCHNLTSVDNQSYGVIRSTSLAVAHVQNLTKIIKTTYCMKCHTLQLKKIIRAHMHADIVNNKTNYIIAFEMSPGDVAYEATVQEDEDGFHIIQPTYTISTYNTRGNCVMHSNDRGYCVCEKQIECNKYSTKHK